MFSETRYAPNGELRVAYRASREGPRHIVFVPMWFSNCDVMPELLQGWVEAMTSLGRLIFCDQPGTGAASDPVTAGALPTLEQWADSITAVLDDLGSREAVLLAGSGALATGALFAATHPSRTTALVAHEVYADPMAERTDGLAPEEVLAAMVAMWGTGQYQHALNPDMPWNEEIRATWARAERRSASPGTAARMMPLVAEMDVRALLPAVRVPTLVIHHADDPLILPEWGKDVADQIAGAKYVELPGRNVYHFVEPWRPSFQEIAEFLTAGCRRTHPIKAIHAVKPGGAAAGHLLQTRACPRWPCTADRIADPHRPTTPALSAASQIEYRPVGCGRGRRDRAA